MDDVKMEHKKKLEVEGEKIDLAGIAHEHGKENVIRQIEDVHGTMNLLHPEEAHRELKLIMDRECQKSGLDYNQDVMPRFYRKPSGRYGMIAVLKKSTSSTKDPFRNMTIAVPNTAEILKGMSRGKETRPSTP